MQKRKRKSDYDFISIFTRSERSCKAEESEIEQRAGNYHSRSKMYRNKLLTKKMI